MTYPRIVVSGDSAVNVEFGNEISEDINRQVSEYVHALEESKISGITGMIPTFRSVLISYDPRLLSYGEMISLLTQAFSMKGENKSKSRRVVEIPVCYGGEYGPDLAFVAEHANLTPEEVVRIHSSREYLIYMIGFLPGFPYLGGLDSRLVTPRLSQPRVRIPAGSVGIGGEQTGLYPLDSPGGWQLIGRTPIQTYLPSRNPPVIYEAGDWIRFVPVTPDEFKEIQELERRGEYEYRILEGN